MSSSPTSDEKLKAVVLVGSPPEDGIKIKIQSLGYRYVRRVLTSSPENWSSVASQLKELREASQLAGVIMMWTSDNIDRALLPDYHNARREMLKELALVPAVAFTYEEVLDNLTTGTVQITTHDLPQIQEIIKKLRKVTLEFPGGLFVRHQLSNDERLRWDRIKGADPDLIFYPGAGSITIDEERVPEAQGLLNDVLDSRKNRAQEFIDSLRDAGVEFVPYRTRVERVVRTEHFLDTTVTGEFLRLYIPFRRYQADQLATFLLLFENYVRQIEARDFRIDSRKTEHGVVYAFRSRDDLATLAGLEDAIARFESLLQIYGSNPEQAQVLLTSMGLEAHEARRLLAQFARD